MYNNFILQWLFKPLDAEPNTVMANLKVYTMVYLINYTYRAVLALGTPSGLWKNELPSKFLLEDLNINYLNIKSNELDNAGLYIFVLGQ